MKLTWSLFAALTFVLAPLPNAVFAHCGSDEYGENSGPVDLGRFLTSIIVVSGFALPIILAHSEVINQKACVMSIIGGGCVLYFPTIRRLYNTTQVGLWYNTSIRRCIQRGVRLRMMRYSVNYSVNVLSCIMIRNQISRVQQNEIVTNYSASPLCTMAISWPIPARLASDQGVS